MLEEKARLLRLMGNNMKINWKKLFVIIVLLLFIGTIIAVVLVNIDKINVLNKIP